MQRVRFYLKRPPNKDGTCLIFLRYTYKIARDASRQLSYSTAHYVHPDHWNERRQRPKSLFDFPELDDITDDLERLATMVQDIYRTYRRERRAPALTTEVFKTELDQQYFGLDETAESTMFTWLDDWLKNEYRHSIEYNENTFINYRKTLKLLTDFRDTHYPTGFDFDDINKALIGRFVTYMRQKHGLADNTVSKYLGRLRSFLNAATDAGVNTNLQYKGISNAKVRVSKTAGFKIYLTVSELRRLYEFNYHSDRLRRVADVFVAAAMLGLAHSDWVQLSADSLIEVDGVNLFEYSRSKTEASAVLPLHPIVREVLAKYDGHPPVISNQKSNNALKDIGKAAGFDSQVKHTIRRGGIETTYKERWQLFSTHVARNCFNSNALDAGILDRDVKRLMAHTIADMTGVYDRRSAIRIALSYKDHPFFNNW